MGFQVSEEYFAELFYELGRSFDTGLSVEQISTMVSCMKLRPSWNKGYVVSKHNHPEELGIRWWRISGDMMGVTLVVPMRFERIVLRALRKFPLRHVVKQEV